MSIVPSDYVEFPQRLSEAGMRYLLSRMKFEGSSMELEKNLPILADLEKYPDDSPGKRALPRNAPVEVTVKGKNFGIEGAHLPFNLELTVQWLDYARSHAGFWIPLAMGDKIRFEWMGDAWIETDFTLGA